MILLFIHQNFPGQFKHLAPVLAADSRNRIVSLAIEANSGIKGVLGCRYRVSKSSSVTIHPWLQDIETKVLRAEAAGQAMRQLREKGLMPDVVFAHSGWGEALLVKDIWPECKLLIYSELFYHSRYADVGFDPEFSGAKADDPGRLRLKNANSLLNLAACDWAMSPTRWQRATVPLEYQPRVSVIHDGIDTEIMSPDASVTATLPNGQILTKADEVITFVARNLEPYRGFHSFMRALPEVLKRRPKANVLIVGGDAVSYGSAAQDGKSYRDRLLEELAGQLDLSRIHFMGRVPYANFRHLMQISSAHVYLTYPFVLSWSMLEAMSCGALVIGSDTPPVREVIEDGKNGLLVDFFDPLGIANAIDQVFNSPDRMADLRWAARQTIVERYDLKTHCLPQQIELIKGLARGSNQPGPPLPLEPIQSWWSGRLERWSSR